MIPIKVPTSVEREGIESIVSNVIDAKKTDIQADTTALESQIDQLVYQLYNLTEEEIQIIENV